jgi:uncharacterized membrane protein YdbT with pleckstrin-like domain
MSIHNIVRLKDQENVVGVIRHYPLVYVFRMSLALVLVAAPFFFMIPLFALRPFGLPVGLVLFSLSILIGLYLAARYFMVWYWNAFVLTNFRVIDVDQRGLFDRTVSEAMYDRIQDVSYQVKGVWGTMLHYGTVVIQTAGATTNLELFFAHDPKEIHHVITELMSAYRTSIAGERSQKVTELLDAAASLSDAEARAFLTGLKTAIADSPAEPHVDDKDVERLMNEPPPAEH